MAKNLRVHELAKELGMTNAETVELCHSLGVPIKGSTPVPSVPKVRETEPSLPTTLDVPLAKCCADNACPPKDVQSPTWHAFETDESPDIGSGPSTPPSVKERIVHFEAQGVTAIG